MNRILCSSGAIIGKPNGRDYRLLDKFSKRLICDGFELMIYPDWYDYFKSAAADIKTYGICIPVVHCDKKIGEEISLKNTDSAVNHFEKNCEMAADVGANKLVLHLWNGIISDSNINENIEKYFVLNEIAKQYGLVLCVENVVCNHEDPLKHWKTLYDNHPDISFVFDTKMAAFHGQLGSVLKSEYKWLWDKNLIKHFHINDYHGGIMDWSSLKTLHLGAGDIDFQPILNKITACGYEGDFTIEATSFDKSGNVDFDLLQSDIDKLKLMINNAKAKNVI